MTSKATPASTLGLSIARKEAPVTPRNVRTPHPRDADAESVIFLLSQTLLPAHELIVLQDYGSLFICTVVSHAASLPQTEHIAFA